ncbi:TonB-dependent receptor domain-containing protein, partial [Escherichia coli]
FESTQAELLLSHQRVGPLSGLLGFSHQSRDVTGSGSLRYLPDVDSRSNAVFLKETLDFGWATFDAGARHERVEHALQPSRFKTARNAANTKLQDRSYRLNSFSLGSYVELGPLFAAKVRYASSQRAPEINELYASNAHYSVMT